MMPNDDGSSTREPLSGSGRPHQNDASATGPSGSQTSEPIAAGNIDSGVTQSSPLQPTESVTQPTPMITNSHPPTASTQGRRPSSPSQAAAGSRSPEELLRRLSLTGDQATTARQLELDLRATYPSLKLTGNVISATFCVPYKVNIADDGSWQLNHRRGTSALFESFAYLASPASPWKHNLVGWTGEIDHLSSWKAKHSVNGAPVPTTKAFEKLIAPARVHPLLEKAPPQENSDIHVSLERREELASLLEKDHGGRVTPVWLADDCDENKTMTLRDQQKWRWYGEHELFTLFHYKQNEPSNGRAIRKAWADYYRMNKAFADAIVSIYTPGDIILVHDYHLLLLPSLLRQRLPNVFVGFFLHIPFPSSEYYRCLTRRKEILDGMLGANMIGFQAFGYSRHFSSCCTRILGFTSSPAGVEAYGAHVAVDVFPIGINASATLQSAFDHEGTEEKVKYLRKVYAGRKVIVGRDRLDSLRGVAQKLQAFEIFLERHPEWHDKVILIQVTSPTSIEDKGERRERTESKINDLVARINGNFGSLTFGPVHYYPQYISKEEYLALLRIADLGLITSVRDGMNTTALEYILCQRDNHGPLIISEFSGTAGSLGDAYHINPWDLSGVADAINTALTMPEPERNATHARLFKYVTENTIQTWTKNYLKRLLTTLASFDSSIATPVLDSTKLLEQYRKSSRRLFMLDYDGTLTPIVKDPQSAIPSDRVIRTLKALASDHNNSVWIISGRDQAFLDEWMGHISELGLSAEHGSFIRMPNSTVWENLTEQIDMRWQNLVMKVFQYYTERTTGSFIERKKIALTWHYRRSDPEYGAYQARLARKHLEDELQGWDVEVMAGKANLEVRPKFVNKGEIAHRLIKSYEDGPAGAPDFVLCLGDDFTDEDMFRTLLSSELPEDHVFAVTVGASSKQTLATWHLVEPADVISAISMLNGSTDASNVGAVAVVDGKVPESR